MKPLIYRSKAQSHANAVSDSRNVSSSPSPSLSNVPITDRSNCVVAIGAMITDAEDFANSINTVVERLGNDMSDPDVLMQISTTDINSARETWSAMRELSERLASMLSG